MWAPNLATTAAASPSSMANAAAPSASNPWSTLRAAGTGISEGQGRAFGMGAPFPQDMNAMLASMSNNPALQQMLSDPQVVGSCRKGES